MAKNKLWLGMLAMALAFGMTVVGCDPDPDNGSTNNEPGSETETAPEDKPVAERWFKWANPTSTATVDFTVDDDGVCTIVVDGTADTRRWVGHCAYQYTGAEDIGYTYKFEAWTEDGNRTINIQYFGFGVGDSNPAKGPPYLEQTNLSITTERKTYTLEGEGFPQGGATALAFQCADKLGTFYVKVVSITAKPRDTNAPKKITLTGLTGKNTDYSLVMIQLLDDFPSGLVSGGSNSITTNDYQTIELLLPQEGEGTMQVWTGAGEYFILVVLSGLGEGAKYVDYVYTNGKTLAELGINTGDSQVTEMNNKLPKYNIKNTYSIIDLSLFTH